MGLDKLGPSGYPETANAPELGAWRLARITAVIESRLVISNEKGPFQMDGDRTGVLLVHGFTGTPSDMRGLGEHLHAQGWTVVCPLLPGHGTRPADLNRVGWLEWYRTVRDAYFELASRCDVVFAAGLSMGGALALHLAAHHPVAAVATLATGLRPKDWRVPIVPLLKYVLRFDRKRGGEDIKDPAARESFSGYDVWPTWGVHELLKLNRHVREDLGDVTCPLLIVHARDDHTVPVEDADILHDETGSVRKRKLILTNSYHVVTTDYDRGTVMAEVEALVRQELDLSSAPAVRPRRVEAVRATSVAAPESVETA